MELFIGIIIAIFVFGTESKEKKEEKYKVVGKGMNRKFRDKKTGMYIVS